MFAVAKAFKTINRKFDVDDPVSPFDIDVGSALTFSELKDAGFIKGVRVDYDAMTRAELDALAAERGLDIAAAKTKAEIVGIIEYAEKAGDAIATGNLDALQKADLERMAAERGLDVSRMTKSEIVALLQSQPEPVGA